MNNSRRLLAAGCFSVVLVGAAHAGGFSRGTADTDILFEDGNFNMRAGATYVTPTREFSKGLPGSEGLVGTSYTGDYVVPSAAIKFSLTDNFRCAGTMVDNNGGDAQYAVPKPSGKLSEEFTTNEKALTCAVKFQVGPGNFWLIGGAYMEDFDYSRFNVVRVGGVTLSPLAHLTLEGEEFGYRIGAAYDIPDIAFRAQVMYRSGTSYGANGSLVLPGALFGSPFPVTGAAIGSGNLPQTFEVKLQSGIAPGWLAFGSVKWSDWSVQQRLLVTSTFMTPIGPVPGPSSDDVYNWKDGWTVTGGVGHAFNDRVSGLVALTWDQGVSTGYDLSTDTYTLAVGASLKDNIGGELRGGVAYSYLTSAEVTKGSDTGLAVKAGDAFAFNLGYALKW